MATRWDKSASGRYFIAGAPQFEAPYIYTAEYGYTVEGRHTRPKGFKTLARAKAFAEKEYRSDKYGHAHMSKSRRMERNPHGGAVAKPPIGKFIPCSAVRANRDGTFTIKTSKATAQKVGKRNPLDPRYDTWVLKPWYNRGKRAGKSGKYADMYEAFADYRDKYLGPKVTPGRKLEAQESFFKGYMETER